MPSKQPNLDDRVAPANRIAILRHAADQLITLAKTLQCAVSLDTQKVDLQIKHERDLLIEVDAVARKALQDTFGRFEPISADEHDLYTDADKDRPDSICDSNGQVTLGLCKICGKGESQLDEPCLPPPPMVALRYHTKPKISNDRLIDTFAMVRITHDPARLPENELLRHIGQRLWSLEGVDGRPGQSPVEVLPQLLGPYDNTTFDGHQTSVALWMDDTFGPQHDGDPMHGKDPKIRAWRFFEESIETAQAFGVTKSDALNLIDYTFARPVGVPRQEIGGVLLTLAALCNTEGISMAEAAAEEVRRVDTPEMKQKIRDKQASKPKFSSLPEQPADEGMWGSY